MNYNYPHSHQECPTCLRLREENARLKAMLHVSKPELWDKIERLTRERDEARAEWDRADKLARKRGELLGEVRAEVARLEGLILAWRVASSTGNSHEYQLAAEALGGEGARIRAQREPELKYKTEREAYAAIRAQREEE